MTDIVLASWRLGTTKQYSVYLKKWRNYCDKENLDCLNPGIILAIEFLGLLHKQGLGYSAVNTAWSALSSILPYENGITFGDHPLVCRALKGIFELKPALPKYSHIWDVSIVLEYLKVLGYPTAMNLKQLALKLTMLLCLLTGQRCQTVHCMDVTYIQKMDGQYRVTIQQKLKQTKAGKHLDPIDLKAFADDPRICIVQHLEEYLKRTAQLRGDHKQLLISYVKPHRPVSKETVARWVKEVLKLSGIDTNAYGPHSSRAALASFCQQKGLDIVTIMKSAGWSNVGTFSRFYAKPVRRTKLWTHNCTGLEPYCCHNESCVLFYCVE